MAFWFLGSVFFVITFVPRFYRYLNFEYGFWDLGLSAQALAYFRGFDFNPVIPSLNQTFWQLRPQPLFALLTPLAFFNDEATTLLLVDSVTAFLAAGFCVRFARLRLRENSWAILIFFAMLFSTLQFRSLASPGRALLWAQLPLALFLCEYFGKRRPTWMATWLAFLCFCDLHFCFFTGISALMILFFERKRWNLRRRFIGFAAAAIVTLGALWLLYSFQGKISFEDSWPWTKNVWILLWGFAFLPLLSLEILFFAAALFLTGFGTSPLDFVLLLPLAAVGSVLGWERIRFKFQWTGFAFKALFVLSTFYFQLLAAAPFYEFWRYENRHMTPMHRGLHQFILQAPKDAPIAVSDVLTPHFASYPMMLSLLTIDSWRMQPEYVLVFGENLRWERNPQYRLLDKNLLSGARLFRRIK